MHSLFIWILRKGWKKVSKIIPPILFPSVGASGHYYHHSTPSPGPTAIELRSEGEENSEFLSLSSLRGRRGLGRGGPSCLRLSLGVSRRLPLSPALSPRRGEGESIVRLSAWWRKYCDVAQIFNLLYRRFLTCVPYVTALMPLST